MALTTRRSIFPVIGSDPRKNVFGTAFVFHRSQQPNCIYLLTCAHVIRDIEKHSKAQIYPFTTRVIAITPPEDTDDLAIIEISKDISPEIQLSSEQVDRATEIFHNAEPLPLANFGKDEMSCSVYGYYEYISRKEFKLKKLAGKLISETAVKRGIQVHVTKTWDLNFPQKIALRHGYSGSPVIDTAKEMVVGIVRIKEDQSGQRGLAISVEAVLRLTGKLKQEHKKLRNHIHSVLRSDYGFDDLPDISHFETANCNLLPYLADRKAQLDQLGKIVSRHLPKSNATPIIIILHG